MTDRNLASPSHPSVTCALLRGKVIELGPREMRNTSGGLVFPGYDPIGRYLERAIGIVAEVIEYVARPR